MDSCKPDFQNGIVNLMTCLSDSMSGKVSDSGPWPALLQTEQTAQRLREAQHVVLVVLDGVGYHYLRTRPNSFLHSNLIGKLSSVFPSSTAPAVGSYLTGQSPAKHGIFGWFQWMRAIGQVGACLPFESRALRIPLAEHGIAISDCFAFSTFFERLERPSFAYSPESVTFSPFNSYATRGATAVPYASWSDLMPKVVDQVQSASAPTYQYVYWPYFDTSCHLHGLDSAETATQFDVANQGVLQLVKALSAQGASGPSAGETVVLVTADHGMMDTTPADRLQLADFPKIANYLTRPLCGEPRVVYCQVRGRDRAEFPRVVAGELGAYCDCYPAETLLAEGWFGPEAAVALPHQYDALGDYILVMKAHYTLQDLLPGEKEKSFIGMHGGTSAAEMEIPLCWVEC